MSENKGVKHDQGKADLSLLSFAALSEIARAFEFGAKKYGRYNYLNGMEWTRIAGACCRHVYAWLWGEDRDEESGLHHLGHAGACIVMLLDYCLHGLGEDNRYEGFRDQGISDDEIKVGDLVECVDDSANARAYLTNGKKYKVLNIFNNHIYVDNKGLSGGWSLHRFRKVKS